MQLIKIGDQFLNMELIGSVIFDKKNHTLTLQGANDLSIFLAGDDADSVHAWLTTHAEDVLVARQGA